MNGHRTLAPSVRDRGCCRGNRARPRGEGLPRSALPDADEDVIRTVHAHELDVRALREPLVVLDERPEPQQVAAVRLPADDGVRIADRDRRELDRLAVNVDRLPLSHLDLADVHLDLVATAHAPADLARADANGDLVLAASPREPARGDP